MSIRRCEGSKGGCHRKRLQIPKLIIVGRYSNISVYTRVNKLVPVLSLVDMGLVPRTEQSRNQVDRWTALWTAGAQRTAAARAANFSQRAGVRNGSSTGVARATLRGLR